MPRQRRDRRHSTRHRRQCHGIFHPLNILSIRGGGQALYRHHRALALCVLQCISFLIIIIICKFQQEPMSRPKGVQLRPTIYVQRHLILSDSDTFLIWTFPQVVNPFVVAAHTCETSAMYCVSTRTEHVLLFRTRCEFAHS